MAQYVVMLSHIIALVFNELYCS